MPLPLWVPIAAGLGAGAATLYATGLKGEYTDYYGNPNQKARREGRVRMPVMRKFARIPRRRFRRRNVFKRRFKRTFRRKSKASAGFKRRKAFAGSGRFTVRKLGNMMESKLLDVIITNTTLANTGTFAAPDASSGEFCFCPNQYITQFNPADAAGEATASFTGTKIFLKGIHFKCLVTNASSVAGMRIKLGVFKTWSQSWAAFTNFSQITQVSGEGQQTHFYDRVYNVAETNSRKYYAPVNFRGGGPTCIFFKEYFIAPCPNASLESTSKYIDMYLPLNKIETFEHDIAGTDLVTAPNFFKNGDYVFVIKFFGNREALGNDNLRLHSPQFRIHFKDA